MNFFKRETTQEKIERLEIKLAGLLSVDETLRVLIRSGKIPIYIVEKFVKNRANVAMIKKEIEILKTKIQ